MIFLKRDHPFGWLRVLLPCAGILVTTTMGRSATGSENGSNARQAEILPLTVAAGSAAPLARHSSTNRRRAANGDDPNGLGIEHVKSPDIHLIDRAFEYGYPRNIVKVSTGTERLPTLTVNNNGKKYSDQDFFSVWTRDLYWGFLGWAQAGDDSVLEVMKSSLRLLIVAKNKNQALGQSKTWPLNDRRFYVPQAYCFKGSSNELWIAMNFFPWDSESQADFLLLACNYWELSGDRAFIRTIWNDIDYVTTTLELLDTNGDSLPDAVQGSYDYQSVVNSQDPLICAKESMAYSSVAKLARMLGKNAYADRLDRLAAKVKVAMNKDVKEGGFWDSSAGHYINIRKFGKDGEKVDDRFIPYENLVPIWCGMTSAKQNSAIFAKLDAEFDKYYNLRFGPEYCAPAAHNDQSVMDCSSVTWLGFLDVYLRGKTGHDANRSRIFDLLMRHANDANGIPFPEGAGIYGSLTGNGGRAWDNGNFFHAVICGIYGLEKSRKGIDIEAPEKIDGLPLTELSNVRWRQATYNFKWDGAGHRIKRVTVDGKTITSRAGTYRLSDKEGTHEVRITLKDK